MNLNKGSENHNFPTLIFEDNLCYLRPNLISDSTGFSEESIFS